MGIGRFSSRAVVGFVIGALSVALFPGIARADAPYPRPEATSPAHPVASDPYDYEDYTWIDPGTGDCSSGANPGDNVDNDRGLPENVDCKNDWRDTNYAAQPGDSDFDPTVASNPAEMGGVKGSRITQAFEVTTGRPDTVVAVMDSGILWDGRDSVSGNLDQGELNDINGLRKKFFLNAGELPAPGPAGCGSPGFGGYDRNCDGIFNVVDYQSSAGCQTNCVTDVNNNTLIEPQDLILTYSDTVDDDSNGYPDNISGWDFFENDNDANDDVDYGHGTGESKDSGHEAEATEAGNNNVRDDDGICPNCMLMEMRVGDSFVADVNHWAEATVYATDNGASVVQEALGTLNNTSFGQAAADYAYENGVIIVASAADESAGHHNYPSNYNHTMVVNSINKFNAEGFEDVEVPVQNPKSYLYLNGCTNFGGHIFIAIPSSSCSSDATGHAAGQAGILYSAARSAIDRGDMTNYIRDNGTQAPFPLSAEEAMQMFRLGKAPVDPSPR